MQKLAFDEEEVNLYIDRLSSDNSELVKDAAQKLSDECSMGRILLKSYQVYVVTVLNRILMNSKHKHIYKWVYKCMCYYNDEESEKILINNFMAETDSENRVWIISAISSRYHNENELMKVLNWLKSQTDAPELDKEKLIYATSLFSKLPMPKVPAELPRKIIDNKDMAGMLWLAKIYAFPMQARRRGLGYLVNDDVISEMTFSSNKQIQLYSHWSLVNHYSYHLLTVDDIRRKNLNMETLKWYYRGIIVGQFLNHNYELVYDIILMCIYNYHEVLRVKQGVISALLSLEYNSFFDDVMVQWFFDENYEEIIVSLLEYFVKNVLLNSKTECVVCGTFYGILKEEYQKHNYRSYISNLVKVYKTLIIKENTIAVDVKNKELGEYSIVNGANQTFVFNAPIGGGNQIGGTNNSFVQEVGPNTNLERLLQQFINLCTDEELCKECEEVREHVNDYENIKDKIMELVSHLASWLTVTTAMPTVVNAANELIKYLTSMF